MKLRVKIEDELYEVEVGNLNERPVIASVDGESFEIWPEAAGEPVQGEQPGDPTPLLRKPLVGPLPSSAPAGRVDKARIVQAPIPGIILSISVKAGDSIEFGQELCVLEAMKMKNIIRSNRAGRIGVVCVEAGDQVGHGQVLVEYAD